MMIQSISALVVDEAAANHIQPKDLFQSRSDCGTAKSAKIKPRHGCFTEIAIANAIQVRNNE